MKKTKLSPRIEAAVLRLQRCIQNESAKRARVVTEGWSDEALRKERIDVAGRAVERARSDLCRLLSQDDEAAQFDKQRRRS